MLGVAMMVRPNAVFGGVEDVSRQDPEAEAEKNIQLTLPKLVHRRRIEGLAKPSDLQRLATEQRYVGEVSGQFDWPCRGCLAQVQPLIESPKEQPIRQISPNSLGKRTARLGRRVVDDEEGDFRVRQITDAFEAFDLPRGKTKAIAKHAYPKGSCPHVPHQNPRIHFCFTALLAVATSAS